MHRTDRARPSRPSPRWSAAPAALVLAAGLLIPFPKPPAGAPKPKAKAKDPAAGLQWPMAAKDYANTRYSDLADITTDNVKDLTVAQLDGFVGAKR